MNENAASTEPTVLRATSSADFLAALPRLTGISAPESCFVVLFDGKRTIGTARIDLPPAAQLEEQLGSPGPELEAWIRQVAQLALRGSSAVVVLQTGARLTSRPETSPHGVLAAVLADVMGSAGAQLRDALVVGSDGWASFGGGADQPDLEPLSDIAESPLHDPEHQAAPLDEWREQNPGQTSDDPEEIERMAARMNGEQQ